MIGDQYSGTPHPLHADLSRQRLILEHMNLVLPADHAEAGRRPARLDQLSGMAWAVCHSGIGRYEMHLRLCRQHGGFEPDIRYTSDDFATLVELMRRTGAATLLPDLPLRQGMPGALVSRLAQPDTGREMYVLTRRNRTRVVDAVVTALGGTAQGLLLTDHHALGRAKGQ